MKTLPLFPASIVGSIPRPLVIRELIEKPTWDETDRNTMDAAIRFVVALQERAGLDVVNDGEWRRRSYIGVIAELERSGFEPGDDVVIGDLEFELHPG